MSEVRFSIIIPTRERAETLRFSLQTCVDQDFDNYEVIVHDNCSSQATREVVEAFSSDRIRYIRSDLPLAMSDSWERAVSFARGDYVLVIGDDDGLLPHSLRLLDRMLRELSVDLLRWSCIPYFWPNHPLPDKQHNLVIPLGTTGHLLPGREVIQDVANYRIGYEALPMIYNSAVRRDLIESLRKQTGRVFHSGIPDIASGFAFAFLAKNYISLQFPLSIAGSSGKSNSAGGEFAHDSSQPGSAINDDFIKLNEQAGRRVHPKLPNVVLLPVSIADAFMHVKDALFPHDQQLVLNRKECLRRAAGSLGRLPQKEAKAMLQMLGQSLADAPALQSWFQEHIALRPLPPKVPRTKTLGYQEIQNSLGIVATDFGVSDVYGAAVLCGKILQHGRADFRYLIKDYRLGYRDRIRSVVRTILKGNPPGIWY